MFADNALRQAPEARWVAEAGQAVEGDARAAVALMVGNVGTA